MGTMHDRHVCLNERRLLSRSILTAVRCISMVGYRGDTALASVLGI